MVIGLVLLVIALLVMERKNSFFGMAREADKRKRLRRELDAAAGVYEISS